MHNRLDPLRLTVQFLAALFAGSNLIQVYIDERVCGTRVNEVVTEFGESLFNLALTD